MNTEEAREKVKADYEAILGKEILVSELTGYKDDDMLDFDLDPPVKCRVAKTPQEDLIRRVDDWIDPYWNLELAEKDPRLDGVTSLWMYGTSYNVKTGGVEPARLA